MEKMLNRLPQTFVYFLVLIGVRKVFGHFIIRASKGRRPHLHFITQKKAKEIISMYE